MDGLEALGDPTRRRIIEMLANDGEMSAGEIGKYFDASAPAISQHLKVLRDAKLVDARVEGQRRIYYLKSDALDEMAEWLNRIRRFWHGRLNALEAKLKKDDQTKI